MRPMRHRVCHLVLLASLGSGCFLSHGDEDEPPVRGGDAGVPTADASRPRPGDSGAPPVRDAGRPSPACWTAPAAYRAERSCIPGTAGALPAGSNATLELYVDGCFCDETLSCEVVEASGGVLRLETTLCPGRADCDGCVRSVRAACSVPPLTEGTWQVIVNGQPGFDVEVRPPEPGLLSLRVCHDLAPEVDDSLSCDWPGSWSAASTEVCHLDQVTAGRPARIDVASTCGSCFDVAGACEVSVAGGEIVVRPAVRACDCFSCGACADLCYRTDVACHTPPLEPGVYRVITPAGESTLVAADYDGDVMLCVGAGGSGGSGGSGG